MFSILKKNFRPFQFLQIGSIIIFSCFIDVSIEILSKFQPSNIIVHLFSLLIGYAILALGISIEVDPNVLMIPGEAIVKVLALVIQGRFRTVKVFFDIALVVTMLSFLFFKKLNGVGLRKILSALLVGKLVNYYNSRFSLIKKVRNT